MATVLTADPADSILDIIQRGHPRDGHPFVTLAYAQSLDGSLAARRGETLVISGLASQKLTHRLRASHSAILVGIGTILADDPQLNVRLVPGENPQPVILDSHLRTPLQARIFQSLPPWIAGTLPIDPDRVAALEGRGSRLLVFPPQEFGRVPLAMLLKHLRDLGVDRLMVEGGAAVITAFLQADLVDLVVLTIAPILVGGQPAVEALLGEERSLRRDFPVLGKMAASRLGDDLIVWGYPQRSG
jgi:3,4-dihydroxy 2-butanone 4-phosphate synthase/GTP cyclohydrolase II